MDVLSDDRPNEITERYNCVMGPHGFFFFLLLTGISGMSCFLEKYIYIFLPGCRIRSLFQSLSLLLCFRVIYATSLHALSCEALLYSCYVRIFAALIDMANVSASRASPYDVPAMTAPLQENNHGFLMT